MDWLLQHTDPSVNWSYALITLVVRFVGVFVVMLVMQVALQLSARVIRMIETRGVDDSTDQPVASLDVSALAKNQAPIDWRIIAAIGLAFDLEAQARVRRGSPTVLPSSWTVSGRLRQFGRLP